MNKTFCRKCLLKDMDPTGYQNIYDYIESLDPQIKTEEGLYQKRLDFCKSCEHLTNGICRICGCFTEARAAKKQNTCPLGYVWE